jgi:hypothetical protein
MVPHWFSSMEAVFADVSVIVAVPAAADTTVPVTSKSGFSAKAFPQNTIPFTV